MPATVPQHLADSSASTVAPRGAALRRHGGCWQQWQEASSVPLKGTDPPSQSPRVWKIVAEYAEVESGKSNLRPQLIAALADARRTGAKLVVAKLDRIAATPSSPYASATAVSISPVPTIPTSTGSPLVFLPSSTKTSANGSLSAPALPCRPLRPVV